MTDLEVWGVKPHKVCLADSGLLSGADRSVRWTSLYEDTLSLN